MVPGNKKTGCFCSWVSFFCQDVIIRTRWWRRAFRWLVWDRWYSTISYNGLVGYMVSIYLIP